jgi:hypothetical protein
MIGMPLKAEIPLASAVSWHLAFLVRAFGNRNNASVRDRLVMMRKVTEDHAAKPYCRPVSTGDDDKVTAGARGTAWPPGRTNPVALADSERWPGGCSGEPGANPRVVFTVAKPARVGAGRGGGM